MTSSVERRLEREALVAARAQAQAARRHERAVERRERLLLRARRALPLHGAAATIGTLALALTEGVDGLYGVVAVGCSLRLVRAVGVLRHPPPLPAVPAPPPPPRGSSAWPAVVRLDQVRDELRRLVPLVGPAGRDVATEAWAAAAESDAALRRQAARLATVEPHRGGEPELLRSLLAGVACQERVVTAMADLVAATDPHLSPSPLPGAGARLQDAADALHGLADGLRQLR